jgi:hypothetical protein
LIDPNILSLSSVNLGSAACQSAFLSCVVFINSKSGGQLGSYLTKIYGELLNEAQVPSQAFAEVVMLKLCISLTISTL